MAMKWMIAFAVIFSASAFARPGDFMCTTTTPNGRGSLERPDWIQDTLNEKCDKTKSYSVTPLTGASSMMICCIEK